MGPTLAGRSRGRDPPSRFRKKGLKGQRLRIVFARDVKRLGYCEAVTTGPPSRRNSGFGGHPHFERRRKTVIPLKEAIDFLRSMYRPQVGAPMLVLTFVVHVGQTTAGHTVWLGYDCRVRHLSLAMQRHAMMAVLRRPQSTSPLEAVGGTGTDKDCSTRPDGRTEASADRRHSGHRRVRRDRTTEASTNQRDHQEVLAHF